MASGALERVRELVMHARDRLSTDEVGESIEFAMPYLDEAAKLLDRLFLGPEKCTFCDGDGWREITAPPEDTSQASEDCPKCGGTGLLVDQLRSEVGRLEVALAHAKELVR